MKRLVLFLVLLGFLNLAAAKPLELLVWHSMEGYLGSAFQQLSESFNQSQTNYQVKLLYKGEYTDSLTSFAVAFRASKPPAMIQVQEVGTAVMLNPPGIVKPLMDILEETASILPLQDFSPAIKTFYSQNNRLQAMPFNVSVPLLFYNADALAKLGVNADNFPKTWSELEQLLSQLKKAGWACGYTSAYPSWVHVEAFSALHGIPLINPLTKKDNLNNPALLSQINMLKSWQRLQYFEYGGRRSESTVLFTSGRCAIFSQSSGAWNSLAASVRFKLGLARLPLNSNSKRHANVPGGAAIWAVSGQSLDSYKGIAAFFAFLAKPENQLQWHLQTGYLPLGVTGSYAQIPKQSKHPVLKIAQAELTGQVGEYQSYYPGPQNQIRKVLDETLEEIFSNLIEGPRALEKVEKETNFLLARFAVNASQ